MPNLSCSTLATGARQLVVQLAFEMHFCSRGQLVVVHAQHAGQVGAVLGRGAEHDALGAGLQMRVVARLDLAVLRGSRPVKMPVLSTTTSTFNSPQGSSAGSRSLRPRIFLPSTIRFLSS